MKPKTITRSQVLAAVEALGLVPEDVAVIRLDATSVYAETRPGLDPILLQVVEDQ